MATVKTKEVKPENLFLVCAWDGKEHFDYSFCYSKNEVDETIVQLVEDGWDIQFAGKIKVLERYTQ